MKDRKLIFVLVVLGLSVSIPISSGLSILVAPLNYTVHANESPWDSVFTRDVTIDIPPSANYISFSYWDDDIDDDRKNTYPDDVERAVVDESWIGKYLIENLSGNGIINVTLDFEIRFDATGDGDVGDSDDYSVYNDLFFENVSEKSVTIIPQYRIGFVEDLKGTVFELGKGGVNWNNKFVITDYSEKSVSVVNVGEKTFLENQGDMLDDFCCLIPGTDIVIKVRNITNTSEGHSAEILIIENGVDVTTYKRNPKSIPPLKLGVDMNILEDYYLIPTYFYPNYKFINIAIGRKSDELFLYGNDRNMLGYDLTVLKWNNETSKRELIFQDSPIIVEKRGERRLSNTNVYAVYDGFGMFDLVAKKTKSTTSGSTLKFQKNPWNEFLKKDIKITLNNKSVEIMSTSIDEESLDPKPLKKKVIVVANSIDSRLAMNFFQNLENEDFIPVHVLSSQFDVYNNQSLILILGGPDAPEGVGEIVQEVLTEAEADAVREPGAKKMYVKTSVWATGQRVIVLAGSDRNLTKASHEENRDMVLEETTAE